MLSWIGVAKWWSICLKLACKFHSFKDSCPKRKHVHVIQWKCLQVLTKEGKLDPCISLQLCWTRAFKNWIIVNPVYRVYTKTMDSYLSTLFTPENQINITPIIRTLRKTEPRNKQIVSERWSACPLTLHPSLAEKEIYHRMKSAFKLFHNVI